VIIAKRNLFRLLNKRT